jgi:hypothetical protein
MAEPVAAFGLAANVIQFIDIGSRIATNMWGFYRAKEATAGVIPDIDSVNRDLQRVLTDLNDKSLTLGATDRSLVQLAKYCQSTADELNTKRKPLLKARLQARGKREAFKEALKLV